MYSRGDKVRLGRVVIVIPKQNGQKFYSAIAGTIAVEAMAGTPDGNRYGYEAGLKSKTLCSYP